MVNNIGGATLAAAVAVEKSIEPKKIIAPGADGTNPDLNAAVAAYLSLPGFNAVPDQLQTTAQGSDSSTSDQASAVVKAVAEDDSLKLALKQFDDGLKKLVQRPETQAFQLRFGADANGDVNNDQPAPNPLPGVGADGLLASGKEDMAADTNHDGKISEEERIRYEMPLTYRSAPHVEAAAADGPSAFSLTEVNHAYGAVATADATA